MGVFTALFKGGKRGASGGLSIFYSWMFKNTLFNDTCALCNEKCMLEGFYIESATPSAFIDFFRLFERPSPLFLDRTFPSASKANEKRFCKLLFSQLEMLWNVCRVRTSIDLFVNKSQMKAAMRKAEKMHLRQLNVNGIIMKLYFYILHVNLRRKKIENRDLAASSSRANKNARLSTDVRFHSAFSLSSRSLDANELAKCDTF